MRKARRETPGVAANKGETTSGLICCLHTAPHRDKRGDKVDNNDDNDDDDVVIVAREKLKRERGVRFNEQPIKPPSNYR